MRTVDLAVYLDVLAAKHAGLGAQLERSRDRLRQASIEREARRAVGPETSAQSGSPLERASCSVA